MDKANCYLMTRMAIVLLICGCTQAAAQLHDAGMVEAAFSTDYGLRSAYGTSADPMQLVSCPYIGVDEDDWVQNIVNGEFWGPEFYWCENIAMLPRTYPASNDLQIGDVADGTYWTIVSNNEGNPNAFNTIDGPVCTAQCNPGMPGKSLPVIDPASQDGVMGLHVESHSSGFHRAHLVVSNLELDATGGANPSNQRVGRIPFLSFGSDTDTRGALVPTGNPNDAITRLQDPSSPHWLTFVNRLEGAVVGEVGSGGQPNISAFESWLGLIANWGGQNRMILLALTHFNTDVHGISRNWNWPITDSVLYPGAEIAFLDAEDMQASCGIFVPRLQCAGEKIKYKINVDDIYACAESMNLFSDPIVPNAPVTGIHFANELANRQNLAGNPIPAVVWNSIFKPFIKHSISGPPNSAGSHGDVLDDQACPLGAVSQSPASVQIRNRLKSKCLAEVDCAQYADFLDGTVPHKFGSL